MNPEFQECLKRKKIQEFSRGQALVEKEFSAAEKDLNTAEASFKAQNFKWATVQSYYAMFHCARALLYAKNYREKSHFCLITALRALYVEGHLLPVAMVESLQKAKMLRENADYYDDWSESAADSLINDAAIFIKTGREIVSPGKKT